MLGLLPSVLLWQVHQGVAFGCHAEAPVGRQTHWVQFAQRPPPLRRHLVAMGALRVVVDNQPRRIQRLSIHDSSIKLHSSQPPLTASSRVLVFIAQVPSPSAEQLFELSGQGYSEGNLQRATQRMALRENERSRVAVPNLAEHDPTSGAERI